MKLSNFKKILALLLAAIPCVTTLASTTPLAAENEIDEVYENKKAAYREKLKADDITTDDLLIGSFVTMIPQDVMSIEDQLDRWVEAGMNFNFANLSYGEGAEFWENNEALYGERNILYFVSGGGLNADAEVIEKYVSYAEGKEHCIGYFLIDEPTGDMLEDVALVTKLYREADPTRYPFVNHLPSYAGNAALGISSASGNFYAKYIDNYINMVGAENIEYLSHDFYVFMATYDVSNFFGNLETLRAAAYENGKLKTHAFPQSSYFGYGTRMPSIDEMRWNVYAYLAYGFKALSWFNYANWTDDTVAMISRTDGSIVDPEVYEAWCNLNWEARGLSDILMNLDTVHAYHTVKTRKEPYVEILPEDFFIQPNCENAFVISVMEPKEGTDSYIMLFNNDFSDAVSAEFTVDSLEGVQWVEYFDPFIGKHVPMMLEDGILADTFRPGEGKLYRLRYDEYVEVPETEPVEETEEPVEETVETDAAIETDTSVETDAVETDTAADPVDDDKTDDTNKTGIFVAVGVAAIAVIGALAAFFTRKGKKKAE